MKFNTFIFITFTISSLTLFGCDQILDKSLGKINKENNNDSTVVDKDSSRELLNTSNKENLVEKSDKQKSSLGGNLSHDNSNEIKKRYDVIGTNKDCPYRSGETKRFRSAK